MKTTRNKNSAFTLIELLVVIAIIGLLASVVLVALNGARQKSRDAKRIADVRNLATAFEGFFNDAGSYPTGTGAGGAGYTAGAGATLGSLTLAAYNASGSVINFTPSYVGLIPAAPTPFDPPCTAANNPYVYQANNAGTAYTLSFCLGGATGGYGSGVRTLTPSGIQ